MLTKLCSVNLKGRCKHRQENNTNCALNSLQGLIWLRIWSCKNSNELLVVGTAVITKELLLPNLR
jgi:hypothetical protein